ncbi:MAG: SDR family NAD(P)-dependent oxidoreductase [Rhodothalassiaceae bacterium]
MRDPRSILITGASSGIGEALAKRYARANRHLALTGRNAQRLGQVAAACRAHGAEVVAHVIDVADRPAMAALLSELDAKQPLDLIIANAGIGYGEVKLETLHDITEDVFGVNVHGVFHTILPLLPAMRARGQGQIAIVSSVAGFRGLPSSVPYSASKMAVKGYGEALRGAVARHGLEVSVICPGFVESRMTEKIKTRPFLVDADKAARIIERGLERNRGLIAFPWPMAAATRLLTLMPAPLADWVLRRR